MNLALLTIDISAQFKMTRELIRGKKVTFPVLLDGELFCREVLQIPGTPTVFVIDAQGRIRSRLVGRIEPLGQIVQGVIDHL